MSGVPKLPQQYTGSNRSEICHFLPICYHFSPLPTTWHLFYSTGRENTSKNSRKNFTFFLRSRKFLPFFMFFFMHKKPVGRHLWGLFAGSSQKCPTNRLYAMSLIIQLLKSGGPSHYPAFVFCLRLFDSPRHISTADSATRHPERSWETGIPTIGSKS